MSGLIDTHTHLETFVRRAELPAVLTRARAADLEAMITVGTAPDDWTLYRDLAREHAGVIAYTVGLHPCSVDEHWERAIAVMESYWGGGRPSGAWNHGMAGPTESSRPVALGEMGLDRFHLPKDATEAARIFGWQRAAFAAGLEVAKRVGAAVVVHSRGAFRECVELIDASGIDWARVVFHCFSEGAGEMNELVRRGGFGSFTGIITYPKADAVRAAARAQGLARLMVETDAPYLAPVPHRGQPNEPAFVRHTAEFCAQLFGASYEELAAVTTANAKRFFGI
jgi:TatD DNase family protein